MKRTLLSLGVLIAAVSFAAPSFADDAAASAANADQYGAAAPMRHPEGRRHRRQRGARGFSMGVCVGQALSKAGVTLPAPAAGQRPAWDAATKAAFKTAAKACRAEFRQARNARAEAGPAAEAN